MSNLLKVGTTISKSERIIDYNDIIKDRVEAARAASRQKADSDGFINGLNADVVERLPEDEIDTEAAASEEMTQESAEAARAEAEEILAQAKAEAEEILAQAQAQAGQIREEAKKEGFNSGTIESERHHHSLNHLVYSLILTVNLVEYALAERSQSIVILIFHRSRINLADFNQNLLDD